MNSKIKTGLIFVAGLVSGAAGMFVFMKQKWQKAFEAKQEEMLKYFKDKKEEPDNKISENTEKIEKTVENTLAKETADGIITKFNYSKISNSSEKTKNTSPILEDTEYVDKPYIIDPRESGTQEMYDMYTLILYNDGEVRTDKYEIFDEEDIETCISEEVLKRITDMRDSDPDLEAVYVRNDRLRTEYEILIEAGSYDD